MVLRRDAIQARLEELDSILSRLRSYSHTSADNYAEDEEIQWLVERGLLAAAGIVFDVADHVLSGYFGDHSDSYEAGLRGLRKRGVISEGLYESIRGLGGFRNILVHRYLEIDALEVHEHFQKVFETFPRFAQEILTWMESVDDD